MKTNSTNQKLQAALIGVITLIGVFTLLQLGADKRTSEQELERDFQERKINFKNKKLKIHNFKNNSQKVSELLNMPLPSIEEMRSLDEEELNHHQTHMIRAGANIGKIIDQMKDSKISVNEAAHFLENCLSNDQIYKPLRVLCLDYRLNQNEFKKLPSLSQNDIDKELIEILNFTKNIAI